MLQIEGRNLKLFEIAMSSYIQNELEKIVLGNSSGPQNFGMD